MIFALSLSIGWSVSELLGQNNVEHNLESECVEGFIEEEEKKKDTHHCFQRSHIAPDELDVLPGWPEYFSYPVFG